MREYMKKTSSMIILAIITTSHILVACGRPVQQTEVAHPQPTYQIVPQTNHEIVFAGKVVNPSNGEWTNNRVVLVFLKSKEIARATTSTMEYVGFKVIQFADPNAPPIDVTACMMNPQACGLNINQNRLDGGLGISDGIFVLRVPNTYELNLENLGMPINEAPFVQINEDDEQNRFGTWIDPFNEGDTHEFYIPSKNIRYVLKVLPGDISQLPAEIQQPGSIALMEGNRLIAVDPNNTESTSEPVESNSQTSFTELIEEVKEQPPEIYSYNNCLGSVDITHEIISTNIQEITNTTGGKFGVELPVTTWFKFVTDIEKQYSIKNQEIKMNSITLVVPPGENIEFSVVMKQTWVRGVAVLNVGGVDISKPYQFLKSENIDYQQQMLPCP
jgi:hypothetical protein